MRTTHTHLNTIPESRPSHLPTQQPDRRHQPRTRPSRTNSTKAQRQPQHTHTPLTDLKPASCPKPNLPEPCRRLVLEKANSQNYPEHTNPAPEARHPETKTT